MRSTEQAFVVALTTVVHRILRFRVADDRFTECWLYDEDEALIDRAWS